MPAPTPLRCSQTRCWSPLSPTPRYAAMDRKVLLADAAQRGTPHRRSYACGAVQVIRRSALHKPAMQVAENNYSAKRCRVMQRGRPQYAAMTCGAAVCTALTSGAPQSAAVHPIAGGCGKKNCDTPQYVAVNHVAMSNYNLLRNNSDALHRMYSTASTQSGARTDSRGSGGSAALAATHGSGGSTATAARTGSGGSTATATRHRS